MEIKFNNEEVEDIIKKHLSEWLPIGTLDNKEIRVNKYVGDLSIDIYDKPEDEPKVQF